MQELRPREGHPAIKGRVWFCTRLSDSKVDVNAKMELLTFYKPAPPQIFPIVALPVAQPPHQEVIL